MTAFADSEIEYRDLTGPWGSVRLFVDNKDVSFFRDIPAQIGSYQLQEPYSYGPAEFMLPQLTPFQLDEWGTSGTLKWMGNGKPVKLIQVDEAGEKVRTIWRGFVSITEVTNDGTMLHCDGEASGRLAMRIKMPDLFYLKRHVGRKIYDAFKACRLTLTPFLGADVGVLMDGRGLSGRYIDVVDTLLAATIGTSGAQYTIRATSSGDYHLSMKDTDTVDFTAFVGAHGVEIDLADDLSERPNTFYGQGTGSNGLVWINGRYTNVIQGTPPPYPMSGGTPFGEGTVNADTTSGSGVTVMLNKLVGNGYLQRTRLPGGYDEDATSAILDLQDQAGLPLTGDMDPDTWDALYDVAALGYSVIGSYVEPLAQSRKVRKWLKTANGSLWKLNPDYDPSVIQRDSFIDYGANVEKSRATRQSKGMLARAQQSKNWAGTLTLTSDVFEGAYAHSDGDPTIMSRLDIKEGMNVMLKRFDGDTKFHVAVVNVDSDLTVQLGIDTQARDAATLGEVIGRRIESRSHTARQWFRQHLSNVNIDRLQFSEVGGLIFNDVDLTEGWNVIHIFAGEAGSVSRIRIQTTPEARFAVAVTAKETSVKFWESKVPNPLLGAPIDDVFVTNVGDSYATAPSVTFTGGGGSGAAATTTVAGGKIASLTVTSHGTGYGLPPDISFSGGGGSGAKAETSVTLDNPWVTAKVANIIDRDRGLLFAAGTAAEPCGYSRGSFANAQGRPSGDALTGLFLDDGGFDYHTFTDASLVLAIYVDRDCTIKSQQVLTDLLDNGA